MARNIITGLDIGSSAIKVVVAEKTGEELFLLAAVQYKSEGIKHGCIIDMGDAAKSIREAIKLAEKKAGIAIKSAVVSVAGVGLSSIKTKGTIITSRADGEITDYDVKRLISQVESDLSNMLNRQIIHRIPLSSKVDGTAIIGKPVGARGSKLESEILFVACLNQHVSDIEKTMEAARISIDNIVAAPLAIGQSAIPKNLRDVGCVLVDIGAGTVSVVIFENGNPLSLEIFPLGSSHITNDIALGFQISLSDAEKLKIDFGSDSSSKKKLSEIIEARLNDVFELVESHLKKANRNQILPGGIILTGGGSNLFSVDEMAKSSLRLPARVSCAPGNDSINIKMPLDIQEKVGSDPSWSTAVGLCIIGFEEEGASATSGGLWRAFYGIIKRAVSGLIP